VVDAYVGRTFSWLCSADRLVKVGLESEESKGGGCFERSELNAWLANGSSERTVGARPVVGAG
jgi:hypothetical protein